MKRPGPSAFVALYLTKGLHPRDSLGRHRSCVGPVGAPGHRQRAGRRRNGCLAPNVRAAVGMRPAPWLANDSVMVVAIIYLVMTTCWDFVQRRIEAYYGKAYGAAADKQLARDDH